MDLSAEMQAFQTEFQAAERENAGFLFPWRGTFTLDGYSWPVQMDVVQPNPTNQHAYQLATNAASTLQVGLQEIRLLYVSPDTVRPPAGASTAWEGGRLEVLEWSDLGALDGAKTGTAVMRR